MDDAAAVWGADAQWYPDVLAAGDSAYRAWRIEFQRLGLPFEVLPGSVETWHRDAVAEHGERRAELLLYRGRRRFRLCLRDGRDRPMRGLAPDLPAAAGAAGPWLTGARRPAMAAAWPFLGSVALAEADERGDRLEARWIEFCENHLRDERAARLADFLALAFHEPRLRALWPTTSHWTLWFRTVSPDQEGLRNLPAIDPMPDRGRYRVIARGHRVLGETDAAGALRLVLAAMPD